MVVMTATAADGLRMMRLTRCGRNDEMTVKHGIGQGFGFGIGCLLLAVAIVVTLYALGSSAQQNAQIGAGLVPTRAPVAAPPRAATVLLSLKGSGIQRTERFTAPGDWTIAYTYDCASFGFDGVFQIYVNAADGTLVDVAANVLGKAGDGSQPVYKPGSFYLDVNSTCDWTVEVKG